VSDGEKAILIILGMVLVVTVILVAR